MGKNQSKTTTFPSAAAAVAALDVWNVCFVSTINHYYNNPFECAHTSKYVQTRMPRPFFVVVAAFKDRNRSILIGPLGNPSGRAGRRSVRGTSRSRKSSCYENGNGMTADHQRNRLRSQRGGPKDFFFFKQKSISVRVVGKLHFFFVLYF